MSAEDRSQPNHQEIALAEELRHVEVPRNLTGYYGYRNYPCEITTAQGQKLLGIIQWGMSELQLSIPFGVWSSDDVEWSPYRSVVRDTAIHYGVFDTVGSIENDYQKEESLGLTKAMGKFSELNVGVSRGIFEEIVIRPRRSYTSLLKDDTAPEAQVARFITKVEDFAKGWHLKPIKLI